MLNHGLHRYKEINNEVWTFYAPCYAVPKCLAKLLLPQYGLPYHVPSELGEVVKMILKSQHRCGHANTGCLTMYRKKRAKQRRMGHSAFRNEKIS